MDHILFVCSFLEGIRVVSLFWLLWIMGIRVCLSPHFQLFFKSLCILRQNVWVVPYQMIPGPLGWEVTGIDLFSILWTHSSCVQSTKMQLANREPRQNVCCWDCCQLDCGHQVSKSRSYLTNVLLECQKRPIPYQLASASHHIYVLTAPKDPNSN